MEEVKFRYFYQHEDTGRIFSPTSTLKDIEFGKVQVLDRHFVFSKEQYIGLKDREGNDIYKGDIVNVLQHEYNDETMLYEDKVGTIEWYEYGFAIIRDEYECRCITPCEMLAK